MTQANVPRSKCTVLNQNNRFRMKSIITHRMNNVKFGKPFIGKQTLNMINLDIKQTF